VEKLKNINDLLRGGSARLGALKSRAAERSMVLEHIRAALPPKLKAVVLSAGLEHGRLTIGVSGAAWASRLRYAADMLRTRVSGSLGESIHSVRIRVLPPSR
jgi:hypothetical protein